MPQFIDTPTAPKESAFMYWTPGTTETKERADRIARSIAENCSVEEIDRADERPFLFVD